MKPNKKDAPPDNAGLEVSANLEGFRRGDRAWSVRPTRVKLSEFSAEQLAAMRTCPGLTVKDITLTDAELDDMEGRAS